LNQRYQVFVSSTFQDLEEERQEVMQALLELDCIPAGMELFPAANDDQWTLIKKVIDDCDYYLVIVAGRYGSVGKAGISYTEMEYRYALDQGKPIIAFLHRDPGTLPARRCESSSEGKRRLEAFRDLVQLKMVKFWGNPADLGSVVSRSIIMLMRNNPAVGWVRADLLPDENATQEILSLRNRVSELELALDATRTSAPAGTDDLAQGDEQIQLEYHSGTGWDTAKPLESITSTWNEIFAAVAPKMIDETDQGEFRRAIENLIRDRKPLIVRGGSSERLQCRLSDRCLGTIVVQLRALGLIVKSAARKRSLKDTETYWTLTPYGDNVMTKLRAIRRGGDY
jgi:Domain of unknown function (DUF4062)